MKGPKHTVRSFPGEVVLMNTVDTYYECGFETPMELASFIGKLKEAGKRAFGAEIIEFLAEGDDE